MELTREWGGGGGGGGMLVSCNSIFNFRKNEYHNPHPPFTFRALGWNAGKVDCGHYRSQLGFCIIAAGDQIKSACGGGAGFIQDGEVFKGGAWSTILQHNKPLF